MFNDQYVAGNLVVFHLNSFIFLHWHPQTICYCMHLTQIKSIAEEFNFTINFKLLVATKIFDALCTLCTVYRGWIYTMYSKWCAAELN